MTVTKGTLKGSVVVKDGKITEVGEKVMVPQGATVIDAGGQYRDSGNYRLSLAYRGGWRR